MLFILMGNIFLLLGISSNFFYCMLDIVGDLSEGVWIVLFSFKECCILFWQTINLSEACTCQGLILGFIRVGLK